MNRQKLRRYKRGFDRFNRWEKSSSRSGSAARDLQWIGAWVDFYLSRHRRASSIPDVRGIAVMQRRLSVLGRNA